VGWIQPIDQAIIGFPPTDQEHVESKYETQGTKGHGVHDLGHVMVIEL